MSIRDLLSSGKMFIKQVVKSLDDKINEETPEEDDNYINKVCHKSIRRHKSKLARARRRVFYKRDKK